MAKDVTRERLVFSPNYQVQPVDMSQSNVTQQLSNSLNALATVMTDKATKKYELDFKNSAAEGINEAYMRNQNNPQQLDKELKALRGGLLKSSPFHLRDSFDSAFSDASRPYMNKATDGFNRILTDKLQESSLKSMELNKKALSENMAEIMSNDPARQMAGQKSFQLRIQEMASVASQVDATGAPIFSASQRFKFMQDAMNDTVFYGVRESYDKATDKQEFLNRFKNGDLKASIFLNEQGDFAELPIKNGMDTAAFQRTVDYMESDIKSIQLEGLRQEVRKQKLMMEDPAQFAVESGAKTIEDRITAQLRGGVPAGGIKVLTNAEAQQRAYKINSITNSADMQKALTELQQEYGQHYLPVMSQLKKNGLSDQMTYIATLDLSKYQSQADASFAMGLDGAEITKKAMAREGVTQAKIKEGLLNLTSPALEVYASEVPNGETQTATLLENMNNTAIYYVSQGMDMQSAIERASLPVIEQTPQGYINGKVFRVHQGDDINEIEDALEEAINNTKFAGGDFENSVIKRTARPVLHPDSSKYYLKDELGYPVLNDKGNIVYYPINDIIKTRRDRIKAIQDAEALKAFNLGD